MTNQMITSSELHHVARLVAEESRRAPGDWSEYFVVLGNKLHGLLQRLQEEERKPASFCNIVIELNLLKEETNSQSN